METPSPLLVALNQVGTIVQAAGTLVVALLLAFLSRSIRREYFALWAWGWAFLAGALFCLFFAFRLGPLGRPFEVLYFVGEWLFAFFLVAGLRARGGAPLVSWSRLAALPLTTALLLAIVLSGLHPSFSLRFVPQAAIMALAFAVALASVGRLRRREGATPGRRIVTVALAVLVVEFLQYVPVLARSWSTKTLPPAAWSAYAPILDLLLETVLAFGLITLATEDLHRDLEQANLALRGARDRLAVVARTDALTEALNRHAFAAFAAEARGEPAVARGGSVVAIDLDDLKSINDRFGHAAGDAAIRALARAIRTVVRADDLVYRWGGDEFLVVLPGVAPEGAKERFARFDEVLRGQGLPEAGGVLSASWGIAPYSPDRPMGEAVEAADGALYARKRARRARVLEERGPA
jgi:diguanylate cyclase (GGDEF)-like protein